MTRTTLRYAAAVVMTAAFPLTSLAQEDMPGSRDHPEIPRVEGSHIVAYSQSDFEAGVMYTGHDDDEATFERPEGKRTRIAYIGAENMTPLQMIRNYETALASLGAVDVAYSCRDTECYRNIGYEIVWSNDSRPPTMLERPVLLYSTRLGTRSPHYWYGTVTTDDTLYHVSVFSTQITENNTVIGFANHPVVHLEILEIADFEPTLVFIDAEQMSSELADNGSVALYGITFEFDSDALSEESTATLREIATALNDDASLELFVVGHSDNQGTLEYNQDLSNRRAQSVVNALTTAHGISGDRLVGIGVGPVAPVATNETEQGQALNRRVELVKR